MLFYVFYIIIRRVGLFFGFFFYRGLSARKKEYPCVAAYFIRQFFFFYISNYEFFKKYVLTKYIQKLLKHCFENY